MTRYRLCLDCKQPTTNGARCTTCARPRNNSTKRGYDRQWRNLVAQAKTAEPWCHTQPCPYPDAGSQANPLTGDHIIPIARGGQSIASNVQILCKRCNVSKATKLR